MAEPAQGPLVALTRPRADSEELARELEARGHGCLIAPLLEIVPETGATPDLAGVQGLVLTSGNAIPALQRLAVRLPVFAVGDATAVAARRVHDGPVASAASDAAGLARLICHSLDPAGGALLHLAGRDLRPEPRASLEAAGFELRRAVVYRAAPAGRLPAELEAALRTGTLRAISFFSPRTATTFRALAGNAALEGALAEIDALCLSEAVGRGLDGLRFRRVMIAAAPERAALLGLLDGVP